MKKSILSKLILAIAGCLMVVSNSFGQVTGDPHAVLVGSTYNYTVTQHGTNSYEWAVIDGATIINLTGTTANSIDITWDDAFKAEFKPFIDANRSVTLQVTEFEDHGGGKVCSQISQIEISFTTDLPIIAFVSGSTALCSAEGTDVTVEFNGIEPWDFTIVDDKGVAGKVVTGLTSTSDGVSKVSGKDGYYQYTYTIAEGVMLSPDADIIHNLTIDTFVDDNVRKNAGIDNGTKAGTIAITVYQLPQISTISHN